MSQSLPASLYGRSVGLTSMGVVIFNRVTGMGSHIFGILGSDLNGKIFTAFSLTNVSVHFSKT